MDGWKTTCFPLGILPIFRGGLLVYQRVKVFYSQSWWWSKKKGSNIGYKQLKKSLLVNQYQPMVNWWFGLVVWDSSGPPLVSIPVIRRSQISKPPTQTTNLPLVELNHRWKNAFSARVKKYQHFCPRSIHDIMPCVGKSLAIRLNVWIVFPKRREHNKNRSKRMCIMVDDII